MAAGEVSDAWMQPGPARIKAQSRDSHRQGPKAQRLVQDKTEVKTRDMTGDMTQGT